MEKESKGDNHVGAEGNEPSGGKPGERTYKPFSALRGEFSAPPMLYAPFDWIAANRPVKRNDSANLKMLAEQSSSQRANPGYLFCPLEPGIYNKDLFLSKEYMDFFEEGLRNAKRNGTCFSYVDEWTWPSGQAYGNLLDKHPELRASTLHYEIRDVYTWLGKRKISIEESFFTVAAQLDGGAGSGKAKILSSTLRVLSRGEAFEWEAPQVPRPGCWRIYRFTKKINTMPTAHGTSNVNYLDRRLPECFIELAHRPYEQSFREYLGKTVPGFFMDHEGLYGWKLAWSDDLEKEYRLKKGRDIRLLMPLMIHMDAEGLWAKARWDWHDAVSDLYSNNFFSEVSKWASERGMYHTIHFYEEGLGIQAALVGSHFKSLRAVTLPGVDCLADGGLWVRHYKEAQSVAEFEKRRLMCECFGAYGWHMPPVQMKRIGNEMAARSVSHVIQASSHLDRDLRNVVFGPDLPAMPYARHLHHWNDFMRRVSFINSHGSTVPDVLVIYPIDGIWAAAGGERFNASVENYFSRKEGELLANWLFQKPVTGEGIRAMDGGEYVDYVEKVYTGIIDDLTEMNVEFLIGDSAYIESLNAGPVGNLSGRDFNFRAVILPPTMILKTSVAEKLLSFAGKGGEVYIMGGVPAGSTEEGIGFAPEDENSRLPASAFFSEQVDRLLSPAPSDKSGVAPTIRGMMGKLLSLPSTHLIGESLYHYCRRNTALEPKIEFLEGEFPVRLQHRRIEDRDFYWLSNNTGVRKNSKIRFNGASGAAEIWNCETGEITDVSAETEGGDSVLFLSFGEYEGFWLVFNPFRKPAAASKSEGKRAGDKSETEIEGPWNIFVDMEDQPPVPYEGFTPDVPEELKVGNGGINGDLKLWSGLGLDNFNGLLTYENQFYIDGEFDSVQLFLGSLTHCAEVFINGNTAGSRLWPPYEFDITRLAVSGKNTLRVVVGSLLCNPPPSSKPGSTSFIEWKRKPGDSDAGLLGPVRVSTK